MKCSRGALSIVDKIENRKNTQKKKTTSFDEKEKDEVKLHAALVAPSTEYYLLGNLRTWKEYIAQWTWQACSNSRYTGTPEHRNTGAPEHRNTERRNTPEHPEQCEKPGTPRNTF